MAGTGKKPEKDDIEIDFGVGKISFGGLFSGLGNLIDLAARLNEEGVARSGEISIVASGSPCRIGTSTPASRSQRAARRI